MTRSARLLLTRSARLTLLTSSSLSHMLTIYYIWTRFNVLKTCRIGVNAYIANPDPHQAREGNYRGYWIQKPPDASLSDSYSDPKLDLLFSGWGIA